MLHSVNRVAQAAMVSTTLVSRSLVRDVDKELPQFYSFYLCSWGASRPIAQLETFPAQHACSFRGYLRDNHRTDVLSAVLPLFCIPRVDTIETVLI